MGWKTKMAIAGAGAAAVGYMVLPGMSSPYGIEMYYGLSQVFWDSEIWKLMAAVPTLGGGIKITQYGWNHPPRFRNFNDQFQSEHKDSISALQLFVVKTPQYGLTLPTDLACNEANGSESYIQLRKMIARIPILSDFDKDIVEFGNALCTIYREPFQPHGSYFQPFNGASNFNETFEGDFNHLAPNVLAFQPSEIDSFNNIVAGGEMLDLLNKLKSFNTNIKRDESLGVELMQKVDEIISEARRISNRHAHAGIKSNIPMNDKLIPPPKGSKFQTIMKHLKTIINKSGVKDNLGVYIMKTLYNDYQQNLVNVPFNHSSGNQWFAMMYKTISFMYLYIVARRFSFLDHVLSKIQQDIAAKKLHQSTANQIIHLVQLIDCEERRRCIAGHSTNKISYEERAHKRPNPSPHEVNIFMGFESTPQDYEAAPDPGFLSGMVSGLFSGKPNRTPAKRNKPEPIKKQEQNKGGENPSSSSSPSLPYYEEEEEQEPLPSSSYYEEDEPRVKRQRPNTPPNPRSNLPEPESDDDDDNNNNNYLQRFANDVRDSRREDEQNQHKLTREEAEITSRAMNTLVANPKTPNERVLQQLSKGLLTYFD